jgi:hypothetical protein
MYGDFSRNKFDNGKHFTRVLMQQGRPLTDADWNEQATILADREWQLIRSLLRRPHGTFDDAFGPRTSASTEGGEARLDAGTYYVEGLACELSHCWPKDQKDWDRFKKIFDETSTEKKVVLYLEAWNRTVSPLVDNGIREPTLQGCDTSWRSSVAWKLMAKLIDPPTTEPNDPCQANWLKQNKPEERKLWIRTNPDNETPNGPCEVPSDEQLTGDEVLYCIEVHKSGAPYHVNDDLGPNFNDAMRFKWSRDNGAAIYPIKSWQGTAIDRCHRRFESKLSLNKSNRLELRDQRGRSVNRDRVLVELQDPTYDQLNIAPAFDLTDPCKEIENGLIVGTELLENEPARLLHVQRWNQCGITVKVDKPKENDPDASVNDPSWIRESLRKDLTPKELTLHPDGTAVALVNTKESPIWLTLEHGIQIKFEDVQYEEGDVWLIRRSDLTKSHFVDIDDVECSEKAKKNPHEYPVGLADRHHFAVFGSTAIDQGDLDGLTHIEFLNRLYACWNSLVMSRRRPEHSGRPLPWERPQDVPPEPCPADDETANLPADCHCKPETGDATGTNSTAPAAQPPEAAEPPAIAPAAPQTNARGSNSTPPTNSSSTAHVTSPPNTEPVATAAEPQAAPTEPSALQSDALPSNPEDARAEPAISMTDVAPISPFLSNEGVLALKNLFRSPRDLTRNFPARYLNHQPQSETYRRFRAALLVSDILEPSLEQYLQKVEHCLPLTALDRGVVLQDAAHDYQLATDFQRIMLAKVNVP